MLNQIKTTDMNQKSSPSRSLSSANPIDNSDDDIESLSTYVADAIRSEISPVPLVFASEFYVNTDIIFKEYTKDIRLKIMKDVAQDLQYNSQADDIQIYHAEIYYQSMLSYENNPVQSKNSVIRRVLFTVRTFPKVRDCKVTLETHFLKDLGFDMWDVIDIIVALQVHFRLYIPYAIFSCKQAIEYIYDHRMESLSEEEFQKHLFITGEFRESKSEFRRIFVPAEGKGNKNIKSGLDYRGLSFNGFMPYKFLKNMKPLFHCNV